MDEQSRPTLLGSCAIASSAAESRYRVDYPNSRSRSSRFFALDAKAASALAGITEDPWIGTHFLTVVSGQDVDPESTDSEDLKLRNPDGSEARLDAEIEGADLVVMMSTSPENRSSAEVIARAAFKRNIMTAALALGGREDTATESVVAALRPYASVVVVAKDNDYIGAMLTALRA